VLNPDIRLASGCGKELLSVLRRENPGIVVPQLERGDGSYIPVLRREPTVWRALGDAMLGAHRAGKYPMLGEMVTGDRYYQSETKSDWAAGSAMLISAECWQRCGPWDESFFLYSEETDFALRARDAGLPTRLAPAARAVHLEGDSKQSPGLWALLMVNRARLYRRRHGWPSSAAYWAALLLRETSRAVLGSKPSRAAVRSLISPARLREVPSAQTVRSAG
jgi:GT2 family glycosyltransferase